jgi:hypothetical protein
VFVDNLIFCSENKTITDFIAGNDCPLFINGQLTEAGLIENMAQSAAAGAGYPYKIKGEVPPVGYIGAVKNLTIYNLPGINQKITTEIVPITILMNASVVDAKVYMDERLIAACNLNIFLQK